MNICIDGLEYLVGPHKSFNRLKRFKLKIELSDIFTFHSNDLSLPLQSILYSILLHNLIHILGILLFKGNKKIWKILRMILNYLLPALSQNLLRSRQISAPSLHFLNYLLKFLLLLNEFIPLVMLLLLLLLLLLFFLLILHFISLFRYFSVDWVMIQNFNYKNQNIQILSNQWKTQTRARNILFWQNQNTSKQKISHLRLLVHVLSQMW